MPLSHYFGGKSRLDLLSGHYYLLVLIFLSFLCFYEIEGLCLLESGLQHLKKQLHNSFQLMGLRELWYWFLMAFSKCLPSFYAWQCLIFFYFFMSFTFIDWYYLLSSSNSQLCSYCYIMLWNDWIDEDYNCFWLPSVYDDLSIEDSTTFWCKFGAKL